MKQVELLTIVAVAVMAVGLTGCSGVGTTVESVRAQSVRDVVSVHLSAVALVRGWLKVLPTAETVSTAQVPWQIEILPDGTTHLWGTLSDGGTFDFYQLPDTSGHGVLTGSDGSQLRRTWGPESWDGLKYSQEFVNTYADGRVLSYRQEVDFELMPAPQVWTGSAVAAGQTMTFALHRAPGLQDELEATLSDGSRLQLRVPLSSTVGDGFWPQFSTGATGSYVSGGVHEQFTITGADRWEQMDFSTLDGIAGSFSLGAQFQGTGRLERGDQVLGALRWAPDAVGALDLLQAATVELTPSAAARAFQMDLWIHSIASLGPSPQY